MVSVVVVVVVWMKWGVVMWGFLYCVVLVCCWCCCDVVFVVGK